MTVPTYRVVLRIICLVLNLLLNWPLAIYCGWILHQNWRQNYLKQRRRRAVLWIFCLVCYQCLFDIPYWLIVNLMHEVDFMGHSAFNDFMWMTGAVMRWGWVSFVVLRVYLLWYDHNIGATLSTQKWKILLNPSFMDQNWFIQKRNTMGNDIWLIPYILLPILGTYVLIYFATHIIISIFSENMDLLRGLNFAFHVVVALTGAILMAIFWCKYPSFNDTLFIRHELLRTIIILISMGFILLIAAIFNANDFHSRDSVIILALIVNLLFLFIYYYLIIFPYRKLGLNQKEKIGQRSVSYGLTLSVTNITQKSVSDSSPPTPDTTWKFNKSWKYIIESTEGYESFTKFLEKEFSIENIMYVYLSIP